DYYCQMWDISGHIF
nr:immunoglobulin light chain junction region [Macaca mulatta]MOW67149.1 immunoglobulin light chain junction region [Macaca mulatta]MOW67649.1 immunoglobulin light chain junction region [Macaca mulatta]